MDHYVTFVQAAQFPNVLWIVRIPRLYTISCGSRNTSVAKTISLDEVSFDLIIYTRCKLKTFSEQMHSRFMFEAEIARVKLKIQLLISSWLCPSSKTPSKRGSGGTGWPWESRRRPTNSPEPTPAATNNKIIRVVAIACLCPELEHHLVWHCSVSFLSLYT